LKVVAPFHKEFKLQGNSFVSIEELIHFSKEISIEVHLFLKDWFNEKQHVEVNTSGSTGTPKQIQLQKKHMIHSALATGDYFSLPEKTTALLCMSPNYIAGKMMLVRALTLGWQLDVVVPSSNPLEKIDKTYDFSAMVPMQLNNSLEEIYKVKKMIVGGGVVSNELLSKIQHVESDVFATYGMTETITHIAVKKLNRFEKDNENKKCHYQTLPNVSISKDNRGCLVINAPKVSKEIVVTNDLVELISETEFKWLGRYDSVINSGGVKLIPEQIEAKLSEIIENRFFVTGLHDNILGEKLVLIIELENIEVQSIEHNILQKIKKLKTLLKFEIPKEVYLISQFIETPNQKINRKETLKLL